MPIFKNLSIACCCALLLGCDSKSGSGGGGTGDVTVLQDVDALLRAGAGASGKIPARQSDLDRFQSMYTRGYNAVKAGNVIVIWGAALKGEGDAGKNEAVIAYEKAVPTEGGHVLLSAGTVKKMSADEFKAAPKAGG